MNPIEELEQRHGLAGVGRMALHVYRGAREEATSAHEAVMATAAVMLAMFSKPTEDDA